MNNRTSNIPALNFAPEVLLNAQGIRVAFLDVDGVLTDGGLFFTEQGETIKRFSTLDGHGFKLIQQAGITPVIISGRASQPLRNRLSAAGISHMYLGSEAKYPVAVQVLEKLGLDWHQAATMGDDWPDLAVMQHSAFSCAPLGAHLEIKTRAHYLTQAAAGSGAVREFCDLLLIANGQYARMLDHYFSV